MPTGYTHAVKDGISFEEFALGCARAFGALVSMRDEPSDAPIPGSFQPSDYHLKEVANAQAELERLVGLSIAEADAEAEAAYAAELQRFEARKAERLELRKKYVAMLDKAAKWVPPTKDHEGLKEFMVSQLRESIDWDCSDKFPDKAPIKPSPTAWYQAQVGAASARIAQNKKAHAEELQRVASRNMWIADLRQSLKVT